MRKMRLFLLLGLLLVASLILSQGLQASAGPSGRADFGKIEAGLRESIGAQGSGSYLVYLTTQADLSAAYTIQDWAARGQYVYDTLRDVAHKSQASLLARLEGEVALGNVSRYQSYFIVNAVEVTSNLATLDYLSSRDDVASIRALKTYYIPQPVRSPGDKGIHAVEWGVDLINAPDVWADFATTGEGIVVANIDTGVEYTHSALVTQYRGNLGGGTFDHDFNWYDPSAICSPSTVPCDNADHGTHTMGTMVGDDGGANQIGVAPGAKWIAAKGCESFSCSNSALLGSGEWIVAPCPAGTPPGSPTCDPAQRPHIVNNSWGSTIGNDPWYQATVDAWRASGIFPSFSAGNSGPGSSTIGSPGSYCNVHGVGATDISDVVASFSSRGPGEFPECTDKPDVSAPGVNVRSSVPGNSYALFSGTSMASPHNAGCIALLWSIEPGLTIDEIMALLESTGVDLGTPGFDYSYGYGRIDCYAAASQLSPDFRLATDDDSVDVCVPDDATFTINVNSIAGFSNPVTLSSSPAGSFSLNPVTPPGVSDLTISTLGYAFGAHPVTVTGTADGVDPDTLDLTINAFTAAPDASTLTSPADGETDVSLTPTYLWAPGAQAATFDIEVATDPGFGDIVEAATGLTSPSYTSGVVLSPTTTYYWRVYTHNPCGAGGVSTIFSFTTRAVPPILLVDDDDNAPDVRSYYTDALIGLGVDYDVWDTNNSDNEPDLATLSQYQMVIWFTGDEFGGFAGPGATGETELASYLDSPTDNCLIMVSQDYAWDRGVTSFMTGYLGVSNVTSDVGQTTLTGLAGPFQGQTYTLSYPFTNYSDRLFAGNGGKAAFQGSTGVAVTARINGSSTYLTMFWGAPWEAIPTAAARQNVLEPLVIRCTP